MPLVSIVLICWNRKDEVIDTLQHLKELDYENYEIILIDNASTDGTYERIKKDFPDILIKKLNYNIGISAYNIGFNLAKGEYIIVLDDDSYPDKNSINFLVERLKKNPEDVAIINFKVINTHNNQCATKDWPKNITSFWGCGVCIKKEFIDKFGGYDENLFLYRNELEMGLRALQNGYRIIHDDKIVAYHKITPNRYLNKRTFYYVSVNDIYISYKYFPFFYMLDHLAYILIRTFIKSFRYDEFLFFKIWKDAYKKIKKTIRNPIKDKELLNIIYNNHNKKYLSPRLSEVILKK